MNFKKLLSLLLIFCLIFSFVACGSKDNDDDDDGSSQSSSQKDDDDDDDDKDDKDDDDKDDNDDDKDDKDDDDKDDNDGKDDNDDDKDAKDEDNKDDDVFSKYEEVDLPKGYPEDKYPIYKDSRVWFAIVDKSSGLEKFSVSVICKEEPTKVSDYYHNLIKDSEDFQDLSMADVYMYTGKYEGYQYTISCANENASEENGYTLLTIMLDTLPSIEGLLESLNEGELPENYPADKFPIIDGAAISNASESESGGLVSYDLNLYTDKSHKEILAFYEEAIGEITNKSKSSSTEDFSLSGEAHGYEFDINGRSTEKDGIDLTEYWISLYPLSE